MDDRTESVGKKIRAAELLKVPYMLVVGDSEEDDRQVAVRRHGAGDLGAMTVSDFAARVRDEIERRPESDAILAANEGHPVPAHRKPLKRPCPPPPEALCLLTSSPCRS